MCTKTDSVCGQVITHALETFSSEELADELIARNKEAVVIYGDGGSFSVVYKVKKDHPMELAYAGIGLLAVVDDVKKELR